MNAIYVKGLCYGQHLNNIEPTIQWFYKAGVKVNNVSLIMSLRLILK